MKNHLLTVLTLGALFVFKPSFSQVVTFQETALFNKHHTGYSILNVTDATNPGDHYLLAGTLVDPGQTDSTDLHVLYTDANGSIIWERTYDTGNNERCLNVAPAPDGYVLTGYTDTSAADNQIFLLKIDNGGNILNQMRFETPLSGITQGLSVRPTLDTGYIVTGFIADGYSNNDSKQSFLLKTDSLFVPLWSNFYDTPWDINRDEDMGESVIEIPGHGYFFTGSVNIARYNFAQTYYLTDQGVLAMMVDLNGNLLWNSSFSPQDSATAGHWNVGVKPIAS